MTYKLDNYHPDTNKIPTHVGIIADGTRRWAKLNEVSLFDAYQNAGEKSLEWAGYLFQKGVSIISIYVLSTYNLRRPDTEVDAILKAVVSPKCIKLMLDLANKHSTAISLVGERGLLNQKFLNSFTEVENKTQFFSKTRLYLLTAYNPLFEITSAIKNAKGLHEELLDYLWIKDPVDAIIRTSGANLLSNFLPIQSGFARFYVIDTLFNDCKLEELDNILDSFSQIDRFYGN